MIKVDEIYLRSRVIQALESIKIELTKPKYPDENVDEYFRIIFAMEEKFPTSIIGGMYKNRNSGRFFSGKFSDAIEEINSVIQEKLKPYIDEQKEAIKKML